MVWWKVLDDYRDDTKDHICPAVYIGYQDQEDWYKMAAWFKRAKVGKNFCAVIDKVK